MILLIFMHSQISKTRTRTKRKSFGNLGVHKNEENHALPEPKNENRKSFGNLGVHKIEQNHALPEPKTPKEKVLEIWECIKVRKIMHSQNQKKVIKIFLKIGSGSA